MAPPKQKSAAPDAVVADPAPELPPMTYLTNPVTVAHQTPRTRDEIAIRDAVRVRLGVIENAVVEFVAGQTAEGLSLAEIDALYAIELPILFGYHIHSGRVRASYDAQIVERSA
ncbi:hypothetical protein ACCT18_01215 [Rhizobium ruizarguesonis]